MPEFFHEGDAHPGSPLFALQGKGISKIRCGPRNQLSRKLDEE